MDTASLEFGAAPEAVNQVQPALRLRVADIVSTPSEGMYSVFCQLMLNIHFTKYCIVIIMGKFASIKFGESICRTWFGDVTQYCNIGEVLNLSIFRKVAKLKTSPDTRYGGT